MPFGTRKASRALSDSQTGTCIVAGRSTRAYDDATRIGHTALVVLPANSKPGAALRIHVLHVSSPWKICRPHLYAPAPQPFGPNLPSSRGVSLSTVKLAIFNPRARSLIRGSILVIASFPLALLLAHFPENHPTPLLALPALAATAGLVDHIRCMRTRWSWYHGGVLLCIYADLMVLSMILFFLIYPYIAISGTH